MNHDFLLVIPAYRESHRLPVYLGALASELASQQLSAAILVVDDGSGVEETAALLREIDPIVRTRDNVLEPLCLPNNLGKGGTILAGWKSGHSTRWLGFVDADGAIPAGEVVRIFKMALADADAQKCWFASRIRMLGRDVDRNLRRHLSGRAFASLVGLLIHPGVYDSQCGFKLISADAYAAIRKWVTEPRFAFDVELLAALIEAGFPIEEVPIHWHDVAGSKVSFVRDTINMFRCLLKIRAKREGWRSAPRNVPEPGDIVLTSAGK